jgi:hypothetical protein
MAFDMSVFVLRDYYSCLYFAAQGCYYLGKLFGCLAFASHCLITMVYD